MGCIYLPTLPTGISKQCLLFHSEPKCEGCTKHLEPTDAYLISKWVDQLGIIDRFRNSTTALRNVLGNRGVFLMCGGPSANAMPLEKLAGRGVWTMTVNNACGHPKVRPQAMVCSDPPKKFTYSVWMDPGIMKFVPNVKMSGSRGRLRKKENGRLVHIKESVADCPNVWGFTRYSWLSPDDTYFLSDGACWGNHKHGTQITGQPKTVCTMLLAIRLLKYLGARRVYLIGVDFRMTEQAVYSFDQGRDVGACQSNNAQFAVVNEWLCQHQRDKIFARYGLEIFNCYQRSGLRAFPYFPFEEAIKDVRGDIEEVPDLSHWYDPEPK